MSKYLTYNGMMILTPSGKYISGVRTPIPPEPEYTVTIGTSAHGSVTASSLRATAGTTITLTATPDTDYQLDYFTLNGIAIVGNSFTMPSADVTVSAVFVATGPSFDSVTIGSQTWMSKNLAIDDGGPGIYTQTVNYGQGNVTEYYYIWPAALRIANSIDGWHLPTAAEWSTLANTVGGASTAGTKLKSTYGWKEGNGTDDYGFSAFPAGNWVSGSFNYLGSTASFWTATVSSSSRAYRSYFLTIESMWSGVDTMTVGYSVRLVKDSE